MSTSNPNLAGSTADPAVSERDPAEQPVSPMDHAAAEFRAHKARQFDRRDVTTERLDALLNDYENAFRVGWIQSAIYQLKNQP